MSLTELCDCNHKNTFLCLSCRRCPECHGHGKIGGCSTCLRGALEGIVNKINDWW